MVVMGVLLVVLRGQVRGLCVRVVVLLEGLVVRPVPVETALVDGREVLRGWDLWVMGERMVVVVMVLQHGRPCPNNAHPPPWLAATTTVQACSVHPGQETCSQRSRLSKILEFAKR